MELYLLISTVLYDVAPEPIEVVTHSLGPFGIIGIIVIVVLGILGLLRLKKK